MAIRLPYGLVEFKLHSIADEDTIDVEADKGLTLLDVCQNEGVDVTGEKKFDVMMISCLRWRW